MAPSEPAQSSKLKAESSKALMLGSEEAVMPGSLEAN